MIKLRELFSGFDLVTLKQCLDMLNWSYDQVGEHSFKNLVCDCGSKVKVGGWVGTEHAYCPTCRKGCQDMTGILPTGINSVSMIDIDTAIPEDGKVWVAKNVWGFK